VEDFAIFPAVSKILAIFCFYVFCSIFYAIFKVEKLHSGCKFRARVSIHTTTLKF